ncbi:TPA: hypothetical protein QCI16_004752 [Enterobacter ludwigii]|nr:hypothetical protein [Enterobacter ludwigii]HDR2600516.1 hypothetical protein [Enterobacter ludwigii]
MPRHAKHVFFSPWAPVGVIRHQMHLTFKLSPSLNAVECLWCKTCPISAMPENNTGDGIRPCRTGGHHFPPDDDNITTFQPYRQVISQSQHALTKR